jgi:hypothetical protein
VKITYAENPLRTTVELDEHDREVFWLKLKVKELEDRLFDVHFSLTEAQFIDLDRAKREADPAYYIQEDDGEKTPLDKRVDRLFNSFVRELVSEHCGDCTSTACSCIKCRAEGILGIDTVKHFHGKLLRDVDGAFAYREDGELKQRSIGEAIAYLRDHKIDRKVPASWRNGSQEEYEKFIPRWEETQRLAYEGLKAYAAEHFGELNV